MNPQDIYTYRPKEKDEDERAAEDDKSKKRKNRTRGKDRADKSYLDKQSKRDQIRREMISQSNIARLKLKMAEKIKRKKEANEVGAIEDEVMSRIPQMVRHKLEKSSKENPTGLSFD
jgi:hypothetical protein